MRRAAHATYRVTESNTRRPVLILSALMLSSWFRLEISSFRTVPGVDGQRTATGEACHELDGLVSVPEEPPGWWGFFTSCRLMGATDAAQMS